MKDKIIQILLFIVSIPIGLMIFYYAPLSSKILETYDFPGKVMRVDAQKQVEDLGIYPMYSWYQISGITPYVIVMSQNSDGTIMDKVYINALNGTVERAGQLDKYIK